MSKSALFIRHKTKPGMRDAVQEIWEKWVKPRAAANPEHLEYFFCYDEVDPDTICVFQLYSSKTAAERFMSGDWYPQYLQEISAVVADAPLIQHADLVWQKSNFTGDS